MPEPPRCAIARIRLGEPEPARAQRIPQRQARPSRRLERLVGAGGEEGVGQQDGDLLLALAVEQPDGPGDRRTVPVEPAIHLRARGAAMPGKSRRSAIVLWTAMRADA